MLISAPRSIGGVSCEATAGVGFSSPAVCIARVVGAEAAALRRAPEGLTDPPFACDATPSRGEPTPAVRRRDGLGPEGAFGITVSPLLYLNTGPRSCKLLEKCEHLLAPQLLPQNRPPGGVHSVKLENVFRRIHTNSANLFHGRPPLSEINSDLILAPLVPSGAVHTKRTSTMACSARSRWGQRSSLSLVLTVWRILLPLLARSEDIQSIARRQPRRYKISDGLKPRRHSIALDQIRRGSRSRRICARALQLR